MSETTETRKTLRRAIAQELQMPFFRRFAAGESTTDTGSTASQIKDSSLTQRDGFWNGNWLYMLGTGEVSIIRQFEANGNHFFPEQPLAAAPADTGDAFEIHSVWNALEIHAAINRAIREVGRIFPKTVVDKTLIVEEDKLEYSLTGLTDSIFRLNKVYVENPASVHRTTATAGGASTVTVVSIPSDIDTNWKVSIYAGTGSGQIRTYVSASGLQISVAAWTTVPDSTSKIALWDPTQEVYDWTVLDRIYQDAKEFPDVLRLRARWPSHYGMRFRLEYLSIPSDLSADTDTTVVPKEFVINRAISLLHGQKMSDTRADRDMHYEGFKRYGEQADAYVARFAPHIPDSQLEIFDGSSSSLLPDPLGWNDGY